jgi:hypothetical protein
MGTRLPGGTTSAYASPSLQLDCGSVDSGSGSPARASGPCRRRGSRRSHDTSYYRSQLRRNGGNHNRDWLSCCPAERWCAPGRLKKMRAPVCVKRMLFNTPSCTACQGGGAHASDAQRVTGGCVVGPPTSPSPGRIFPTRAGMTGLPCFELASTTHSTPLQVFVSFETGPLNAN